MFHLKPFICEKIVENIDDGLIFTDSSGIIQYVNQKAQILIGYTRSQVIGKNFDDMIKLFHYNNDKQIHNIIDQVIESKGIISFDDDLILLNKIKEKIAISIRVVVSYSNEQNINGIILLIQDRSIIKDYEIEMQKALRINSIGKLSSGIAHDFNNILTSILGNISLAKLDIEEESEMSELLEEAEQGIEKARAMTDQLLTFSHEGQKELIEIDIDDLLHKTIDFTLSGSNVICDYRIPENLWKILGSKADISQAIHNVIINAVQAMPIGGTIILEGKNIQLRSENELGLKVGDYIQLEIIDQGIGIPAEEIPYIFDPFYKSHHTGKGMGLVVVKNIINQHHGSISIDSELDKGTTVQIILPALKSEEKEEVKGIKSQRVLSGKILIMDDEEVIRRVLSRMLEQFGYIPESVTNGEEAIETFEKHMQQNDPFDAVILDLTIKGGMGGLDTQRQLLALDPEVRTIASSGYSNDEIIIHFEKYGFKGRLIKPYKVKELKDVIESILGNNSS